MTESDDVEVPFDPTGYFLAKIISGNRITIPRGLQEAFKIEEGDLVTMRFVRVYKKAKKKQEEKVDA